MSLTKIAIPNQRKRKQVNKRSNVNGQATNTHISSSKHSACIHLSHRNYRDHLKVCYQIPKRLVISIKIKESEERNGHLYARYKTKAMDEKNLKRVRI